MAAGARAMPGGRQRGFAMVALITLMTLMSAWLIATALQRTNSELARERDRTTLEALQKAKAALIAYAASEQWQLYRGEMWQPGALPCPDRNGDGQADCWLPHTSSTIGRLPWKTLGIDELRDSSGEVLWYALSASFRKAAGTSVINSDTTGQLRVSGSDPATNVVAIVFAPGAALATQNRPADRLDPAHNNAINYLESFNVTDPVNYVFTSQNASTDTFNDRLAVVTQAQIMAAVEPVVAALIERDVKPFLSTYFSEWGAYPFPARFDNPDPGTLGTGTTRAQSAYVGDASQTAGLLPLTATAAYTLTGGSAAATVANLQYACGDFGTGYGCIMWRMGFAAFPTGTVFTVQAQVPYGAASFAKLPAVSGVTVQVNGAPGSLSSTSLTGSTSAASTSAAITYTGTYTGAPCTCWFWITIPDITTSALTSSSEGASAAYWFIANEWYRQTFYAVSTGFLPGSGGACNPSGTPSCLTVGNLPPSYAVANDKRAILLLAGRALNGTGRPSSSLVDYLEGNNTTTTDAVFEHRAGVSTSINDRVVVLAP